MENQQTWGLVVDSDAEILAIPHGFLVEHVPCPAETTEESTNRQAPTRTFYRISPWNAINEVSTMPTQTEPASLQRCV